MFKLFSKKLGGHLYEIRRILAGAAGNGLRLWQRLFEDFEGGDILTDIDGREKLSSFSIAASDDIIDKLDEWMDLAAKYGTDIGWETKRMMLLRKLPAHWRSKILDKPHLVTAEQVVEYIQKQQRYVRADQLASAKAGKMDFHIASVQHLPDMLTKAGASKDFIKQAKALVAAPCARSE